MTTFSALGLSEPLLRAIEDQGFTSPTPIQEQAIPHLMQGHDITGMAQTGGGKTAAFVLPVLHAILEEDLRFEPRCPTAVILAPTRELAAQIGDTVHLMSRQTNIKHVVINGGAPFKPQTTALLRGVHILVATPGRLQDHVRRGNVKFTHTRFFMLDEADRMLDMGFIDEVQDIAKKLPAQHQTVLFSATMHKSIRKLSESLQRDPIRIEVQRETGVASTIEHRVMHVKRHDKTDLLMHLLEREQKENNLTLVFTRTKRDADSLTQSLERIGYLVDALHGDKPQRKRQQILRSFKNGQINVLVATDVAARGIDVKNIGLVVNYDMPLESENYIHRVGRTGRAGESGMAVSFCSPGDVRLLVNIQELLKKQIEVDEDHEWHHTPGKTRHKSRDFGGHNTSHNKVRSNSQHAPAKRKPRERSNDENSSFVKQRPSFKAKPHDRDGVKKRYDNRPQGEFKKRDDSQGRDGFKKRDDNRPQGEFKKRDDSQGRDGFKKRDDNRPQGEFKKRDDSQGRDGFKKPQGRDGFNKRDDNRPQGEFKKRDDSQGRDGFKKPQGRDGFKKRDDNRPQGEFKKRDESQGRDGFRKNDRNDAYKSFHKRADRQVSDAEALKKLLEEKPQQTRASVKRRAENNDDKRPIKVKLKGKGKLKNKGKSKKLKARKSNAKSSSEGGFGIVQRRGN